MKINTKSAALFIALIAVSTCSAGEVLENGTMRLVFDGEAGGYGLLRVENRSVSTSRFGKGEGKDANLWSLEFWREGCGAQAPVRLDNRSACTCREMIRHPDGGATFVWKGLDLPGAKGAVDVRAHVRFAAEGDSRWTLEVHNQSATHALAYVDYPIMRHVTASGEGDVLLPRSDTGARLVRNAPWGGRNQEFGCMAYYPMMMAFFTKGAGLYVGIHDSEARIKSMHFGKEHDFKVRAPVENAGRAGLAAGSVRFETTIAAIGNDWWEAARRYRTWALTTKWASKGRILDRSDYPRRMAEIPLWFNIHGGPDYVSNVLVRAKKVFPDTPSGVHWHAWQHSLHDVNYPEYFPEQPGTRDCLEYVRSLGQEAMPYAQGRMWSTNLLSFTLARPYAITCADGQPVYERYGKLTCHQSPMCPHTALWDEVLNDFSGRILNEVGASSLFLDQIGAVRGKPCHNPSHGHPLGGGTWYFDGYQRLLAKTHAAYSAKGAFLTTEGSGEEWMNVIDGYLTVTPRKPDDVPFLHAVYSGYTTYFCSPENHNDDLASFRALQTRELLWGQSLGWFHPDIMDQADKCALLNRLVAFRQANLDCLAYGEMLDEVRFRDAVPRIKVTWLGRKAFFLWAVKDAPLSPTTEGEMPGVLGYVWRSGVTGRRAAILANVGADDFRARFRAADRDVDVTVRPGDLTRVELD